MRSPLAAPRGALFLLAACSGQAKTEDKPAQTETTTDESTLPDTGGGEPIELTAIGKGELLRLDGDHECGFTIDGKSGHAVIAKNKVGGDQIASGAYKIGGQALPVAKKRK